jgi:hypothetical protein
MIYSWTQPCCITCWQDRNSLREPMRLRDPETELCVFCGRQTRDGIYVRVDPSSAAHPSRIK